MRTFRAVSRTLSSDLLTPVAVYLSLNDKQPCSFLLESFQGGESWGRYSFIGLPAEEVIQVRGQRVSLLRAGAWQEHEVEDPLTYIQDYLRQITVRDFDHQSRFRGGLVGYFSYDCVRYVEPRLRQSSPPDDLQLPNVNLMLCTEFIIFDNVRGEITLVVLYETENSAAAERRLAQVLERLQQPSAPSLLDFEHKLVGELPAGARSSASQEAYEDGVRRIREYIMAGDVMQVVPSQRFELDYPAPPINFYRALRCVNPSPYMYFIDFGDCHIAGASPEVLARLQPDGVMTLRPIAGTRPRASDPAEDLRLERELLADAKEIAEHVMLIDLARNDLGKIAKTGSVRVDERMVVERYSHVMHIVSNVNAVIDDGYDAIDLLRAAMPAGTLSGAPKIRAMEIIDELEAVRRGLYGGALGYVDLTGSMDMAIPIRTGVIKANKLYLQGGAGIVADSDPRTEWLETMSKRKALFCAYELALAAGE